MSPAYNQYREDVGEYGACGLSSLAKKTRTSNHLQMLYQRQHILLSYLKTLSVVVVWGLNPQLPTALTPSLYKKKWQGHIQTDR